MTRKTGLGGVAVAAVKNGNTIVIRYTEVTNASTNPAEHPEQVAKADQVLAPARRVVAAL